MHSAAPDCLTADLTQATQLHRQLRSAQESERAARSITMTHSVAGRPVQAPQAHQWRVQTQPADEVPTSTPAARPDKMHHSQCNARHMMCGWGLQARPHLADCKGITRVTCCHKQPTALPQRPLAVAQLLWTERYKQPASVATHH